MISKCSSGDGSNYIPENRSKNISTNPREPHSFSQGTPSSVSPLAPLSFRPSARSSDLRRVITRESLGTARWTSGAAYGCIVPRLLIYRVGDSTTSGPSPHFQVPFESFMASYRHGVSLRNRTVSGGPRVRLVVDIFSLSFLFPPSHTRPSIYTCILSQKVWQSIVNNRSIPINSRNIEILGERSKLVGKSIYRLKKCKSKEIFTI